MSHAYQLMDGLEAEVSLENALAIALHNEKFHDVTLKGKDGVTVSANRVILALRSKFFQTMFLGSFAESKTTTTIIETDYPGEVIQAVVEYIHTDKATILSKNYNNEAEMQEEVSDTQRKEFQTFISLTAASAYYNLPNLCSKVHTCMKIYLQKYPLLSIALLEATCQEGPAISKDVLEVGLSKICSSNFEMLQKDVIYMMSSSALSLVISNKKVKMADQQRFEMIQQWAAAAASDEQQCNQQFIVAKSLIQNHVSLQWIDPDFLSTSVAESGLVTKDQLLDAFQFQARRAKHEYNVPTQNPFFKPQWSTSESPVFSCTYPWASDRLKVPPLSVGKRYCWTVKTQRTSNSFPHVWLGITKRATPPTQSGGNDRDCWGISDSTGQPTLQGAAPYNSCIPAAKFGVGSYVTITVDLSVAAPHNGVLSISVNNEGAIQVIRNLRAHLDGADLWPAVSCCHASVTIENIEEEL